jgi:hypothetical protein
VVRDEDKFRTTYNHSTRFRMGILIARQKRGECWIMVSIAGASFKGAPSWEKEPVPPSGINADNPWMINGKT